MKTVEKALGLLDFFNVAETELGLNELARRLRYDKASTRRLLIALCRHGYVEQDQHSRKYRLGPAVLYLAQRREANYPLSGIGQPVCERLCAELNETVHFSWLVGGELATLAVAEPDRANRVVVHRGGSLPVHATASGLASLSHAETVEDLLSGKLTRYTANTPVTPEAVRARLDETRRRGYAINEGGYEESVTSVAAPVFDSRAHSVGAIAAATPDQRFDPDTAARFGDAVRQAARDITRGVGGREPTRTAKGTAA